MPNSNSLTRRGFLRKGLLGSTAISLVEWPAFSLWAGIGPRRNSDHGLKLGLTSYTLRKFSLDQAIAMTKEADVRYISLKEMHLPLKSTPEQRREAHEKIKAAGLVLLGGGVIYMKNDEEEIHAAFDYAKDAGMPTIVCSPDPEALDKVERYAKKYRLRIAIHNHGPGDKRYPSPLDVLALIKDRDKCMGICMDVGHTVRNGDDPVTAIEKCGKRLHDFHMKDVTAAVAKGETIEVGKGVIDIPGVLKALLRVKFSHHVALEYEANADNPMPGVKGSIAYIRQVLANV